MVADVTAVAVVAVLVALLLAARFLWLGGRVLPLGRYLIFDVSVDLWMERWLCTGKYLKRMKTS